MEAIFPGRPLRKMLPEEPVFSAYYKLGAFSYKKGDGTVYEDAPCLEGIDFGCRTGVIFSPCDMTCGWDGHEHPRGLRVVIDQARQIGANMVTYVLGSYQLGRFSARPRSTTRRARPAATTSSSPRSCMKGIGTPIPRRCTTC